MSRYPLHLDLAGRRTLVVGAGPVAVLRDGVPGQLLLLVGTALVTAGTLWTDHLLRTAVPR